MKGEGTEFTLQSLVSSSRNVNFNYINCSPSDIRSRSRDGGAHSGGGGGGSGEGGARGGGGSAAATTGGERALYAPQ